MARSEDSLWFVDIEVETNFESQSLGSHDVQ